MIAIYGLRARWGGPIRYIGQTLRPGQRLSLHVSAAKKSDGSKPKDAWIRGLLERGHRPVLDVLERVQPREADARGAHWIAACRDRGARLLNVRVQGYKRPDVDHDNWFQLSKSEIRRKDRDVKIGTQGTAFGRVEDVAPPRERAATFARAVAS